MPRNLSGQNISVFFYGTPVEVPIEKGISFSLVSIDETEFNKAWKHLSKGKFRPVILACQNVKQSMNLNGWALYKLVSKIGEQLYIQHILNQNEVAVFETFLLVKLGYDARVAYLNNQQLFVACPAEERFASVMFMPYKGKRFYVLSDDTPMNATGRIFPLPEKKTENLRPLDLSNSSLINFNGEKLLPRTFKLAGEDTISVSISLNKGLMDFYEEMPQVIDLSFYAKQPLSPDVERQLIPFLKDLLNEKEEEESANILLQFILSAFQYKTDAENFGYERSFFKEEMFYHLYNDCEDRSIIFAYLVEKLLGLDTVILEYSGHASTGIRFNSDVPGDYIVFDGQEYVLCDPSFVNSHVGYSNPEYKNKAAYIYNVKLDGN